MFRKVLLKLLSDTCVDRKAQMNWHSKSIMLKVASKSTDLFYYQEMPLHISSQMKAQQIVKKVSFRQHLQTWKVSSVSDISTHRTRPFCVIFRITSADYEFPPSLRCLSRTHSSPINFCFKIRRINKGKPEKANCRRHSLKTFALHKYVFLGFERSCRCDYASPKKIPFFRFISSFSVIGKGKAQKNIWQTHKTSIAYTNKSNNKIINYFNFPFSSSPPPSTLVLIKRKEEKSKKEYVSNASTFRNWISQSSLHFFCAMISWWCSKYKCQ